MSQSDIDTLRRRAEALMQQAMDASDNGQRARLVDRAAQWHACALTAARACAAGEAARPACDAMAY